MSEAEWKTAALAFWRATVRLVESWVNRFAKRATLDTLRPALEDSKLLFRRQMARLAGIDPSLVPDGGGNGANPRAQLPASTGVPQLAPDEGSGANLGNGAGAGGSGAGARRTGGDGGIVDPTGLLPPNVQRALEAQLRTSGRRSLQPQEVERFLTGLGMLPLEARGIVQVAATVLRTTEFGRQHFPKLQVMTAKTWFESRSPGSGDRFIGRVLLELGEPFHLGKKLSIDGLELSAAAIAQRLEQRGWVREVAVETADVVFARLAFLLAGKKGR